MRAEVTDSGSFVTISGGGAILTLGYGPTSGTPFLAHTVPPWVNIETLNGILHRTDNLLIDGLAFRALSFTIPGGVPSPLFH